MLHGAGYCKSQCSAFNGRACCVSVEPERCQLSMLLLHVSAASSRSVRQVYSQDICTASVLYDRLCCCYRTAISELNMPVLRTVELGYNVTKGTEYFVSL